MFIRTALLSLSALVAAKELPKDEILAANLYDSGIRHANNVALKKVIIYMADLVPQLGAYIHIRNTGQYRKLQAHTSRRSTLRSRRKLSASTGLRRLATMSSVAAT
jgi:hypothetical protein